MLFLAASPAVHILNESWCAYLARRKSELKVYCFELENILSPTIHFKHTLSHEVMQGQAWGTVFTLLGIYGAVGVGVWMYDKPHKKPYVSSPLIVSASQITLANFA